jgi:hypothetical protein
MEDEETKLPLVFLPLELAGVAALLAACCGAGLMLVSAAAHIDWRLTHGGRAGAWAILMLGGPIMWLVAARLDNSRMARWARWAGIAATVAGFIAFTLTEPPA